MNRLVILEIDTNWSDGDCRTALAKLPGPVVERAERYRCAKSRQNLVASQVALRQTLNLLNEKESSLRVCDNGRPFLEGSELQFNLSHSEHRAVIAMARDVNLWESLGVDVEWTSRKVERDALSKRFFTPEEHRFTLGSEENFFRIWTRKEAVLKSNGIGLRVELDSFQVLDDEVAQEITGRPLILGTSVRDSGYLVSWAVASEWAPFEVSWVRFDAPGWRDRLMEGIRG